VCFASVLLNSIAGQQRHPGGEISPSLSIPTKLDPVIPIDQVSGLLINRDPSSHPGPASKSVALKPASPGVPQVQPAITPRPSSFAPPVDVTQPTDVPTWTQPLPTGEARGDHPDLVAVLDFMSRVQFTARERQAVGNLLVADE
jgi:hypothetical protein